MTRLHTDKIVAQEKKEFAFLFTPQGVVWYWGRGFDIVDRRGGGISD